MPLTLSRPDLRALAKGDARGTAALGAVLKSLGWTSGLQQVGTPRKKAAPLWELSIAAEPAALMTFVVPRQGERLTSLGYTRQARYAMSWSVEQVSLYDTLRWSVRPGDTPLFVADAGDKAEVAELLELFGRDEILDEVPSDLLAPARQREALPALLGNALRRLRLDVADVEAYSGRDPVGRDTAVLRLFHQILYVRVAEDRRQARSRLRVREVLDSDRLGPDLEDLLADYREQANSELFEPAGITVDALPAGSLREVLRQTVEPWDRLRLDFSVARKDLAGRLYESYLASLPAEEHGDGERRRLFPVARGIDQREKQATFYTPPALARLLTEHAFRGWADRRAPCSPADIRVVDPACGSGAFLIAAYEWLRKYFEDQRGRALRAREREELLVECIFGADVDERALGLAQVQLLETAELTGRLPSLGHNLLCGDSLPAPPGVQAAAGQISWDAIVRQRGHFTMVLGNPPFGAQAKLASRLSVEQISKLVGRYPEIKAFGQDYAYCFLALGLRLLAKDASAGLVMPRGLLGLGQGATARRFLAESGIGWICDLRAARVFPGVSASVAGIVLDRRGPATVRIESVADSRTNPRALLDDLASGGSRAIARRSVRSKRLSVLAASGWTPFRVRWENDLRGELTRSTEPLLSVATDAQRDVRTGVKTARVDDFIIGPESCDIGPVGKVVIAGREIPERFLPRVVYASDISPFYLHETGRRLLLPFERDGQPASDPELLAELTARGGLPANYQHGYLPTLLGPKVLLRAVAQEPAAVADPEGRYVPVMRGVHALRIDDLAAKDLPGVAALFNSAFYQWLLRGLGSPRADETVEVTVADMRSLPFPKLSKIELTQMCASATAVVDALSEENPVRRVLSVRDARGEVDTLVFEILGVSRRMRNIVKNELIRVA